VQAYATPEQLPVDSQLPTFSRTAPPELTEAPPASSSDHAVLDQILGRLADLVIDRLLARTDADVNDHDSGWLDARGAAAYLGMHRDTLRKLAARRSIPSHQDGPRCKLYFRRDELDEWRRSARRFSTRSSRLRAVS